MMDKKQLIKVLFIPLSIVLFLLLFTQISISDVITAMTSVSLKYLILSFILYAIMNAVRAVRFSVMLNQNTGFHKMFNIVCIHNMANNIMPFKTGELAFVYLAKSRLSISTGIGIMTVALARMYDALSVCILFLLSLALINDSSLISSIAPYIMFLFIILSLTIIVFKRLNKIFVDTIKGIRKIRLLNSSLITKLLSKIEETSNYYASTESRKGIVNILLSLIIWALSSLLMYFLISDMGISLNIWMITIGTLTSVIFSTIPVHGIGRFGTSEVIWSAIFIALGASKEVAISSGIVIHLITMVYSGMLWLYAITSDRYLAAGQNADAKTDKTM